MNNFSLEQVKHIIYMKEIESKFFLKENCAKDKFFLDLVRGTMRGRRRERHPGAKSVGSASKHLLKWAR